MFVSTAVVTNSDTPSPPGMNDATAPIVTTEINKKTCDGVRWICTALSEICQLNAIKIHAKTVRDPIVAQVFGELSRCNLASQREAQPPGSSHSRPHRAM